jgi:hypothetical protein
MDVNPTNLIIIKKHHMIVNQEFIELKIGNHGIFMVMS